ncbi:MAG: hypothetical protein Q9174_002297 [Haloplaca sp. 1 TL-2023]
MADGVLTNGMGDKPDGILHKPKEERPVVLKFGGTSVGKFAPEIAQICLLLKAARDASKPPSQEYKTIISKLEEEHLGAARCIKSSEIVQKLQADITAEFQALNQVLDTVVKSQSVDPQSEDRVISVGEKLSSRILAALLEDRGIPSEYVDLSDIIQPPVPDRLGQQFYQDLSHTFSQRLSSCHDRIPVITGFFGRIPNGLVNTLGRGYSDLCAALVAVGLQATELQVWKEVDGVFTADPRKVPTARLLPSLTSHEAGELTFYGSEVIHNLTLQQCVPRIPIRIKNVLRPHSAGTVIQPDDKSSASAAEPPWQVMSNRPKRPTAVTVKEQITVVNVHSNRKVDSPFFLAQICTILSNHSLAVDLFEKNECHVSLAVHNNKISYRTPDTKDNAGKEKSKYYQIQDQDLKSAVRELEEYGVVDVVFERAILSLIGTGMRRNVGIAGRLFTSLGSNNINVGMISQGASEISIACVIEEREALRALNVVHSELFTYLD